MPLKNPEIKDFDLGIASSPHRGFGDMRNLDISSRPGVARINYATSKKSASTVTDLIKWFIRNPRNPVEVYAIGDTNKVYKSTDDGDSWSYIIGNNSGAGQGGIIYKDYLFVTRNNTIDIYGPLSGSPTWTNSWKTIDFDDKYHPMILSNNDGLVYGGAGRYIFSIDEVAGQTFLPSSSGTYTFVQRALTLPAEYRIKCLAELGENVVIGTWIGTSIYDIKVATVFPWDRVSETFGTPLQINENGINQMICVNNILYIQAGIDGKYFSSNGVQAALIAKIPLSITNMEAGHWMEALPGAMVNHKDKIYFGVSAGAGVTLSGMGVWSLDPSKSGNKLNYENTISTGNDGTSLRQSIGALLPGQINTLLIGWQDGGTYGIDKVSNEVKYSSYSAYFESAFYSVGTNKSKKMYQQIEFLLAKGLDTGQGIKLKYRTSLSDSFTTIGTYEYVTLVNILSYNTVPGIPQCEFIQIRGELTTNSTTTPELKMVLLN